MNAGSTIEELYLREVADGQVRAKRTLRVFQHQNERLATMEKDLSSKFNSLKDLQHDHSELLEVHHYQKEVQDLQRELIKLQEIQYLTEFTNIMDEDGPSQYNEMTQSLNDAPPANALSISTPTPQTSSQIILKPQFSSDKSIGNEFSGNDLHCLPSVRNSINSLQSLLEFIKGSVAKANRVSSEQDEFTGNETKLASSSGSGMVSKDAIISVKTGSGHKRQKASESSINPKDFDEDKEKIVLLRETLSSHRDSIEALSAEVIELRTERIELMDHLNDLLSWRMQMEKMMSEDQSGKHDADLEQEIHSAAVKSMTNIMSPKASSSIQCDRYSDNNNYKKECSPTCSQEECCKKKGKLENRAYRMWTTACKFFTPQEAHFILTAPVPPEEMESEDDDEI